NVNISRSGVQVEAIQPIGSFIVGTNYFPDAGIYDVWWGVGSNFNFSSSAIWNGSVARAPRHPVRGPGGTGGTVAFTITPNVADSFTPSNGPYTLQITKIVGITNQVPPIFTNVGPANVVMSNVDFPSNIVRQAVFVSVSDPANMGIGITWEDSSSVTNPM